MDTCICMAESLPYSPETTTTLLVSYIPIQNKKFKVEKKKRIKQLNSKERNKQDISGYTGLFPTIIP